VLVSEGGEIIDLAGFQAFEIEIEGAGHADGQGRP
jgi:hypothetical protein